MLGVLVDHKGWLLNICGRWDACAGCGIWQASHCATDIVSTPDDRGWSFAIMQVLLGANTSAPREVAKKMRKRHKQCLSPEGGKLSASPI
jgi:hypothetical protein